MRSEAARFRRCGASVARRIACAILLALLLPPPAGAYSVLSHEEVVDMAWADRIVPMLKQRFPGITGDDIRRAHAYAYGGSVIQDIGYYPFGSHYFSDLLHYVRPQEFVNALIRDSTTPDEYAFALGALAHFCGDTVGHPTINEVTADENPPLRRRFGRIVTYGEDPLAHIRTEFGFDVVEVSQGHYSQENYRDFIGFQVAKPLLERAFQETYGVPVNSVMTHEDLAISTYRRAVSSIIPKMTRLAFISYKDQIQKATPGIEKRKFIYRLDQTAFKKEFGSDYQHTSFLGHIAAFFLRIVPKIGPFRTLKVTLPDSQEQDLYIKSMNATVDQFRVYLAEISAAPAPLPPPDPQDAEDDRKAAAKAGKDAATDQRLATADQNPRQKAALEQATVKTQQTSERAGADDVQANSIPAGTPISPPTPPNLPELDLDTGKPSAAGEYPLADQSYAHLLDDLVKSASKPPAGPQQATSPAIDPALAASIQAFFARRISDAEPPQSPKDAAKAAALVRQEEADLAALQTLLNQK
jgi:hypothetical protein